MTWLIPAGIVVLGLLVLIGAVMSLLRRLGRLRRVERSLRVRADQAKQLQEPVAALQRQVAELQTLAEGMQEQAARRTAG